MATTYTPLLGLALPVTGELSGSWGDVVNDSITQLVEDSVADVATFDVTSGNWTLSSTAGVANEARKAILIPTGTPGVTRNIVAPSRSKTYIIINKSNASVVIKGSATTGVTIVAGQTVVVAWNGSDFEEVVPSLARQSLTSNFSIATTTANTSINLSGGTANQIPYQTGVGATGFLPTGTSGQILTSQGSGTAPIWASIPGGIALDGNNTWTGIQSFVGTTSTKSMQVKAAAETVNVVASAIPTTANIFVNTAGVYYYTSNATANWTTNLTYSAGTTLNTAMSIGDSMTVAVLTTQGNPAFYNTTVQVDGASTTVRWQGGTAPVGGNTTGIDAYTYTVIKTANATFVVLAAQTRFA